MIEVLAPHRYAVRITREIGQVTFTDVAFFSDLADARNYLRRNSDV